jgi:two-component system, OmpR family, alkaline phosphatase synthesis response regulator PhoP
MARPGLAAANQRGYVLVVDDDESFVGYTQAVLEQAGYPSAAATTGEEALSMAREQVPLVVLLDIQLPKLNGYEVCRTLREEFGRALGIAFVSGSRTDTVDISSGLLVGADDYLVKPCDPSELVARVAALMRRVRPNGTNSRSLTSRETEVLRLLSDGLEQGDIAGTLSISPKTVAIHIEHILGKLHVHSRAQAVAAAYRENLIG